MQLILTNSSVPDGKGCLRALKKSLPAMRERERERERERAQKQPPTTLYLCACVHTVHTKGVIVGVVQKPLS